MADVTVYRIQTAGYPQVRIGMSASEERAAGLASAMASALQRTVEVVPVEVHNPVWAGVKS
jgi:hypothetical protein